MTIKKVCGVCENEFWARTRRAKYCGSGYRKLANALRVSETLNSKEGKSQTKSS